MTLWLLFLPFQYTFYQLNSMEVIFEISELQNGEVQRGELQGSPVSIVLFARIFRQRKHFKRNSFKSDQSNLKSRVLHV